MRYLVFAADGAQSAVGLEQTIERRPLRPPTPRRPRSRRSNTELNAPSMSNAAASALRRSTARRTIRHPACRRRGWRRCIRARAPCRPREVLELAVDEHVHRVPSLSCAPREKRWFTSTSLRARHRPASALQASRFMPAAGVSRNPGADERADHRRRRPRGSTSCASRTTRVSTSDTPGMPRIASASDCGAALRAGEHVGEARACRSSARAIAAASRASRANAMKPPTPHAMTSAIASTWLFSAHRSRSSLRSSARRPHQRISAARACARSVDAGDRGRRRA